MLYKKLSVKELKEIVKIHKSAFPEFFLTSLGDYFLETYYKSNLKNSESVALGAYNEKEKLVGFCVGCLRSLGYHRRLVKKNIIKFIIQAIIILITKPMALLRLTKNFEKNKNIQDDGEYAELLSIGVSSEQKGSGIGKELILRFEKELINHDCKKVTLTTDANNNESVIAFYKKRGYSIFYEFMTYPNRKMFKMIKNL